MIFSKLTEVVTTDAHNAKEGASYSGSWGDGGSASLLQKLDRYKHDLAIKYDLRPSEYHKLNSIEVGEPTEFIYSINRYKQKLANKIKL